jgi:hypothetical protein
MARGKNQVHKCSNKSACNYYDIKKEEVLRPMTRSINNYIAINKTMKRNKRSSGFQEQRG